MLINVLSSSQRWHCCQMGTQDTRPLFVSAYNLSEIILSEYKGVVPMTGRVFCCHVTDTSAAWQLCWHTWPRVTCRLCHGHGHLQKLLRFLSAKWFTPHVPYELGQSSAIIYLTKANNGSKLPRVFYFKTSHPSSTMQCTRPDISWIRAPGCRLGLGMSWKTKRYAI